MNRRAFLQFSAAASAVALAATDSPPREIIRTTRLYPAPSEPGSGPPVLTEILALEDRIVCLRYSPGGGPATLKAMKPAGATIWERPLPQGLYLGLGVADHGRTILVQTLEQGLLAIQSGAASPVTTRGTTGTGPGALEKIFSAGDGFLIRPGPPQIELWDVQAPSARMIRATETSVPDLSNVDMLSKTLAAIVTPKGDKMWTVSITDGSVHTVALDAKQWIPTRIWRVATGSDRAHGRLLVLYVPSNDGIPWTLVSLDASGSGTPLGTIEPRAKVVPLRLMRYGAELGIAFSDGEIAWYEFS